MESILHRSVKSKRWRCVLTPENLGAKIFDSVGTILNFISAIKVGKYFKCWILSALWSLIQLKKLKLLCFVET